MSMAGKKDSRAVHRVLVGCIPPMDKTQEREAGEMVQALLDSMCELERRSAACYECAKGGPLEETAAANLADVREMIENIRAIRAALEREPRG
jgi:hypothetical protein